MLLIAIQGREREQETPSNILDKSISQNVLDLSPAEWESEAQDRKEREGSTVVERLAEEPPEGKGAQDTIMSGKSKGKWW
jgi:hypothetical protein